MGGGGGIGLCGLCVCRGDGWLGLFIYFHDYLPIIVTQCKLNTEEKTKQHLLYIRRRLPLIEA